MPAHTVAMSDADELFILKKTLGEIWAQMQQLQSGISTVSTSANASGKITRKQPYDENTEREQLATAISANDLDAVTRIVEKHPALLRKRDKDGHTPLTHAASAGAVQMVSHLILLDSQYEGCDNTGVPYVLQRSSKGDAPIHCAIAAGHLNVIDLLIEAGTPLAIRSAGDHIPLLAYASRHGEAAVAHLLACLPPAFRDLADDKGRTAVYHAAKEDGPASLTLLLKTGCKANLPANNGNTPLHVAARLKNKACAEVLLASASQADIDAVNDEGNTALHIAAQHGNLDTARLLVRSGASIDTPNRNGYTALAMATEEGHKEVMTYLVKHRAQIFAGRYLWAWPLTRAAKSGDPARVDILRKGKGFVQADSYGPYMTRQAIATGNVVMLEACLTGHIMSGASVRESDVRTYIDGAVDSGNPEIIALVVGFIKKYFYDSFTDAELGHAFVRAHAHDKIEVLLPIASRLKHLALSSGTLGSVLASAQARNDYLLLDALAKLKIKVDGGKLATIADELLRDPLARELLNPAKAPKRSLATAFKKPKPAPAPSIDATNTASQLALDATHADPSTAIAATLAAQKISPLLHQPIANSLIPLCAAFASAGNLQLSQAQYIIGHGLAQYADPAHLPLPAELHKLSGAPALLQKCDAHREALADAGITLLARADDRINSEFIHALALVTIRTPVDTVGGHVAAIAQQLAIDFGLLPIWANQLAKVCARAGASVITGYQGSFNTARPPADLKAKLCSTLLRMFAQEMKAASAPEGFIEASLAIDIGLVKDFNDLLWRQWDRICEVMAETAEDQIGSQGS